MTNEDNPYFTNREGNEISQPNFLKSACLVGGTKCVTHLLVASQSTCLLSLQLSEGHKLLQAGTQSLPSSPQETTREASGDQKSCLVSKGALWTR